MSGRLSSYRFRRRLAWSVVAVTLLTVVVVGSILVGNTGKSQETPYSNKPAWVYHEPRLHHLSQGERLALLATSSKFIRTAVSRQNLDQAWEMVGPALRGGMSRSQWEKGDNPVVPFPAAGIAAWQLLYSYDNDVAFDVMVVGKPGQDLAGKTFTIELMRHPERGNRWLVESWVPKGITTAGQSKAIAAAPSPPAVTAKLSAKWLVVPLLVVLSGLMTLTALGIRNLVTNRRAARRYARELAAYRSSAKPS